MLTDFSIPFGVKISETIMFGSSQGPTPPKKSVWGYSMKINRSYEKDWLVITMQGKTCSLSHQYPLHFYKRKKNQGNNILQ